MKQNIFSVLAFAVVIIFMTACGNTKKTTMPEQTAKPAREGINELSAGDWKLTDIGETFVPRNSKAMISFTAGEKNAVAGNGGCNRFMGTFDLPSQGSIKLSPLASTKMACFDDNANSIETKFLAALSKVTNWNIANGKLLLTDGTNTLAKFTALKKLTKDEEKLNANWELNYISGPRIAFNGLYPDKKPTLQFNLAESEVGGNSSCNGFGAKVQVDGSKITFSDPIGTMMACPGEGEQVFYKTLKTITSYKFDDDNTLSLYAADVAVMRFSRK